MASFYGQLADLIHSGVPLLRALDLLEGQSPVPALSQVLREVRAKVADGVTLADAMRPYPQVFNELSVSMIRRPGGRFPRRRAQAHRNFHGTSRRHEG